MQLKKIDYSVLSIIVVVPLLLILAVFLVFADTETLTVTSCSGATSCSVTNYNSNTTSIGHTIDGAGAGETGTIDTFTASSSSGTINEVRAYFRHNCDPGCSGNWDITFQDTAASTTYCTATVALPDNTDTYTEFVPSGCGWTGARLDDLEVTIHNGDGGGGDVGYVYFFNLFVDYTPAGGDTCDYTSGDFNIDCTENCIVDTNADVGGNNVLFSGSGSVRLDANVSNYAVARVQNSCVVRMTPTGGLLQ